MSVFHERISCLSTVIWARPKFVRQHKKQPAYTFSLTKNPQGVRPKRKYKGNCSKKAYNSSERMSSQQVMQRQHPALGKAPFRQQPRQLSSP
ncbi:MAG: hypothetical protein J6T26_05250, partial [Firmicutes bacterium]|nr:hypothetical protein [Bacillota bacterium]